MRKYYKYHEVLKMLNPYSSYEECEAIARKYGLDPIFLFLLLNDELIKIERKDISQEIFTNTEEIEIEDWI